MSKNTPYLAVQDLDHPHPLWRLMWCGTDEQGDPVLLPVGGMDKEVMCWLADALSLADEHGADGCKHAERLKAQYGGEEV